MSGPGIPLPTTSSGEVHSPRARAWRAGALPGAVLGIVCGVSANIFSPRLLAFPAVASGWWAAARLAGSERRNLGERVSAAGAAGLIAAGIVEAGGVLGLSWSFSSPVRGRSTGWDSGILALPFVPLMMLVPAGLTLACTALGGLVSAAGASTVPRT
ncbi:MAG: hypothetical protein ABJC61_12795 [Acidobacteriota bacterium]